MGEAPEPNVSSICAVADGDRMSVRAESDTKVDSVGGTDEIVGAPGRAGADIKKSNVEPVFDRSADDREKSIPCAVEGDVADQRKLAVYGSFWVAENDCSSTTGVVE